MKAETRESCLVCQEQNLEYLINMYSFFEPRLKRKVVICKDCGHIQLFPIYSSAEYAEINNRFFNRKYLVNNKPNPNNIRKQLRLEERISAYLKDGYDVLDVGAGEGWAMDFFKNRKCNYFAIESIERLAENIEERGGRVIARSIFESLKQYQKSFDIILFRHVLEHMLSPRDALIKLKGFLKPAGLIYLVVPNAGSFSFDKGFRTSFLRPVHISYFCEGNLRRLSQGLGLKTIATSSDKEIYFLLTPGEDNINYPNYYHQQKKYYKRAYWKYFLVDLKRIAKITIRKVIDIVTRSFHRIFRKLHLSIIHKIHKLRNKNNYKYVVNILKRYKSISGALSHPFQEYKLYELNEITNKCKPESILEFGSGSSSCIFAHYVKENRVNLICVDESRKWLEHTKKIIAELIGDSGNIQYIHAQKIEDPLSEPKRTFYNYTIKSKYDLVYIDGPSLRINNIKNKKVINSNIVEMIIKGGYKPKIIVVDGRQATARYIDKHFSDLYEAELSHLFNNNIKMGYRYHSVFTLKKES